MTEVAPPPARMHHALLEPVPSEKPDAAGLLVGQCVCGYRSAPGTEAKARAAAAEHFEAVMSHEWIWIVGCPYCSIKEVGGSRSGAFLMWLGHWADKVEAGDTAHPNPPEPPADDAYEGIRLSRAFVAMRASGGDE